jgi:hydroxylysine kinase
MSVTESEILKPGFKIKPDVTENDVKRLAARLYGITIKEISELISYDDRVYVIHPDSNVKNPVLPNTCPDGYILKILNSLDSNKMGFVDAQNKLMLLLSSKGIVCPKPILNIHGNYYSVEVLGKTNDKHIVRLFEYIPGKIFHQVPTCDHLVFQVGEFAAKINSLMKNFRHDAYRNHQSIWMMTAVPKLKEFLYVIKDHTRLDVVEEVIEKFTKRVLDRRDEFEIGMIHGDINEQNLLLTKTERPNEYRVAGILDFGDNSFTHLVFEMAIAMTYLMLCTGKVETGGLFIAGYNQTRVIPKHEMEILQICIEARLCQSLVMGTYTHSLDPQNDYVLTTQTAGWDLLQLLYSKKEEDVLKLWNETADKYLTQSIK